MSGAWDVVADVLGFGGPSGTDHGSSNWAAWGHPEIRSMLDTSVDPGDIVAASDAWREQGRNTMNVITGLTGDLTRTVTGGWRGAGADAALSALDPINQWATRHAEIAQRTTELMDACGSSAGQAKATVPPPKSHNWRESLGSLAVGGVPGVVVDAVAQEHQQTEAHAEAVRIMTKVYSAPINAYRTAVPSYSPLVDPTRRPPEQSPNPGPAPEPGHPRNGTAAPVGGHGAHPLSAPPVQAPSAPAMHPQPASTTVQNVTSEDPAPRSGIQMTPAQNAGKPQQGGGELAEAAVAAAGVPVAGPLTGELRRARTASGGIRLGGGGWSGATHPAESGPRSSAIARESRLGGVPGAGGGRAEPGEMMAPMGAGLGKGGEDSKHRRPSYLIEVDGVFADGRQVAPAVIGEDLSEQDD